MKRMISLLLILGVLLSLLPVSAFAEQSMDYFVIEVGKENAPVRTAPYSDASVIKYLSVGDLLYSTRSKTNLHGNLWFEVIWADGSGEKTGRAWIYSGNIIEHRHTYSVASSEEGDLSFCRCGDANFFAKGPSDINVAVAPALPDMAIGLSAALSIFKGTVSTAFVTAFPYVAVLFTIGGLIYIGYVNCDTLSPEYTNIQRMNKDYHSDDYRADLYYYSGIYKSKEFTAAFIIPKDPMNLSEATSYMRKVSLREYVVNCIVDSRTISLNSLYTLEQTNAIALCEELKKTGAFDYGDDCTSNQNYGYNKKHLLPEALYYNHYHIYYNSSGIESQFKKVVMTHIFFGQPYSNVPASA